MTDDPVIKEMLDALQRNPDALPLRFRVIELLLERLRIVEALAQCGKALMQDPGNPTALELLQRCAAALEPPETPAPPSNPPQPPVSGPSPVSPC